MAIIVAMAIFMVVIFMVAIFKVAIFMVSVIFHVAIFMVAIDLTIRQKCRCVRAVLLGFLARSSAGSTTVDGDHHGGS